ncbi:HAD family hydrolase [Marinobacterium weihaiense]|uniref:HAD family hydrolase n=1 Tax=Marinobacterium weihaiense TaxID=2851016 RepID=A0ABS6MAH0_9GAMM|nr:HAD family hydrolase [Marinobacterium weihaiense]MBV0933278.1 HAD family hydrolase [Marinobacterium weihaiense]
MIKCVTFDLDDTLWAVNPVIHRANQTLWQWLDENAPLFTASHQLADMAEGSAMRRALLAERPEIAHSMSLIRITLLERGCIAAGYTETESILLAERAFEVFMQARHQVELYEHAQAMLEQLRLDGYIIGALSNGNANVAQTPVGNLFDFQFNADGIGHAKPQPQMFQAALKHTGLRPEQVVHVGDHPDNDIRAAAEVGMWTLWVNLPEHHWPQPARADMEVSCLSSIPTQIKRLAAQGEIRATL